jgi:hypothetical protein
MTGALGHTKYKNRRKCMAAAILPGGDHDRGAWSHEVQELKEMHGRCHFTWG